MVKVKLTKILYISIQIKTCCNLDNFRNQKSKQSKIWFLPICVIIYNINSFRQIQSTSICDTRKINDFNCFLFNMNSSSLKNTIRYEIQCACNIRPILNWQMSRHTIDPMCYCAGHGIFAHHVWDVSFPAANGLVQCSICKSLWKKALPCPVGVQLTFVPVVRNTCTLFA